MTFDQLLTIPEQDEWEYSDGKSTTCVAFILEMYKEAGIFGPIANSVQVTEFTVSIRSSNMVKWNWNVFLMLGILLLPIPLFAMWPHRSSNLSISISFNGCDYFIYIKKAFSVDNGSGKNQMYIALPLHVERVSMFQTQHTLVMVKQTLVLCQDLLSLPH